SRQTTLEAPEIQAFLARARDARLRAAVLETSSHGLALHRVDACDYDLAVYTNITHEHLDFHGTFEAYREAKASLIDLTAAGAPKGIAKTAVLNRDDRSYAMLAQRPVSRRLTYGLGLPADVFGRRLASTVSGLELEASTPLGALSLKLPLFGRWNAHNALAAASAAIALDIPLPAIAGGLEAFTGVPGRMERVDAGQPFTVVIDYAHAAEPGEGAARAAPLDQRPADLGLRQRRRAGPGQAPLDGRDRGPPRRRRGLHQRGPAAGGSIRHHPGDRRRGRRGRMAARSAVRVRRGSAGRDRTRDWDGQGWRYGAAGRQG